MDIDDIYQTYYYEYEDDWVDDLIHAADEAIRKIQYNKNQKTSKKEKEVSSEEKLKFLKKSLKKTENVFEAGDVVKWSDNGYNYAAMLAGNGYWYLTGVAGHYGDNRFKYSDFIEKVLANVNGEIKLATVWESVN